MFDESVKLFFCKASFINHISKKTLIIKWEVIIKQISYERTSRKL